MSPLLQDRLAGASPQPFLVPLPQCGSFRFWIPFLLSPLSSFPFPFLLQINVRGHSLFLHGGVVVRDLKGRERAVGGDAEPPLGLKKCSRARQGGRGERHCPLTTGHRGVDVDQMSHLSMVIADSIGRPRGRRARWCLSTYAHLNARTDFSTSLGTRIFSGCLNLPQGVQHYSAFASTYRHSAASSTRAPT